MKISMQQIEAVLSTPVENDVDVSSVEEAGLRLVDEELIRQTLEKVKAMPDREEMIADLKARIEAGEYAPKGEEIADAMIRRTLADRIR